MRVSVDVDIEDILDEVDIEELFERLSDKQLKGLIERKKLPVDVFSSEEHAVEQLFDDLRKAIRDRDLSELTAILDAYENPKWATPLLCEREYAEAKKARA